MKSESVLINFINVTSGSMYISYPYGKDMTSTSLTPNNPNFKPCCWSYEETFKGYTITPNCQNQPAIPDADFLSATLWIANSPLFVNKVIVSMSNDELPTVDNPWEFAFKVSESMGDGKTILTFNMIQF